MIDSGKTALQNIFKQQKTITVDAGCEIEYNSALSNSLRVEVAYRNWSDILYLSDSLILHYSSLSMK
jgi:hypothetical protein